MTTITKMIVHKLNLTGEAPIYSDNLIDLDKIEHQDKTLEFFINHLEINRDQSVVKACKFNPGRANIVRNAVIELAEKRELDDFDKLFINKSKEITDHLYDSMKNKSPSDGALFILLYNQNDKNYIGILKMDPNTGITIDDNLKLHVHAQMLPSINEKLHKSGFIYFDKKIEEREVHLFVLDKQQNKNEPAKYFMESFFKAKEAANDKNLTQHITTNIIKSVCKEINDSQEKHKFVADVKRHMATTEQFDLDNDLPRLIRNYFPDGYSSIELNKEIKSKVREKVSDAVFSFPPQVESIQDVILVNSAKTIKLTIDPSIPKESYELEQEENGYIIFKFRKELWTD